MNRSPRAPAAPYTRAMRRLLLVLLSIAVPTLLVVGCSASSSPASAPGGGLAAANAAGDKAGAVGAVSADRQVVTDGTVDITVKDPRAVAREATSIVESAGGRVDARTEDATAADGKGSARLTLRIPASALTATLDAFGKLGTVENISLTATDVTGTAQDLDARIDAMKISVQRLEDLLRKATTSADLVAAESALNDRQMQLESMQAQRALLADQVSMATIRLGLFAQGDAPKKTPHGFWGGLVTGWNSLVTAVSGALVVLGVLLPWLAFFAVLGAIVWAVVRFARQRRPAREKVPAAPSPAYPPLSMPPPPLPTAPPAPPVQNGPQVPQA